MNDFTRLILVNIGKVAGALLGLITALLIIFLGWYKTLFIYLFVVLGVIIGKWYDEGVSFRKVIREFFAGLRVDKWH
jgi:uncharacterized membrane protein